MTATTKSEENDTIMNAYISVDRVGAILAVLSEHFAGNSLPLTELNFFMLVDTAESELSTVRLGLKDW